MTARYVFQGMLILGLCAPYGIAAEPAPESTAANALVREISSADFPRLLAAIKPQPGESPWREIPWLTNVTEARRRAIAEDKPIVIMTAADGSPLSRT